MTRCARSAAARRSASKLRHDRQRLPDVEGALVEAVAAAVVHAGRHEVRRRRTGTNRNAWPNTASALADLARVDRRVRAGGCPSGSPVVPDEYETASPGVRSSGGVRGLAGEQVGLVDRTRRSSPTATAADRARRGRASPTCSANRVVRDERTGPGVVDDGARSRPGEERVERDGVAARLAGGELPHDDVDVVRQRVGDESPVADAPRRGARGRAGAPARRARRRCSAPTGRRRRSPAGRGGPRRSTRSRGAGPRATQPQRNRGFCFGAIAGFSSGDGLPMWV